MTKIISFLSALIFIGCVTKPETEPGLYGKWGDESYVDGSSSPYIIAMEISSHSIEYYLNAFGAVIRSGNTEIKIWNDSVLQILNRDSTTQQVFIDEYQVYRIKPYTEAPNPKGHKYEMRIFGASLSQECQSMETCVGSFPVVSKHGNSTQLYR